MKFMGEAVEDETIKHLCLIQIRRGLITIQKFDDDRRLKEESPNFYEEVLFTFYSAALVQIAAKGLEDSTKAKASKMRVSVAVP